MKKPEKDPLTYEKPLPLELLPYIERTDAYQAVGTAFALGSNTYVTAAHVLLAGMDSQYGSPALRRTDGSVYAIDRILKFSSYQDFVVFSVQIDPAPPGLDTNQQPQIDDPVMAVGNALGEGIVIRDGLYTSATAEEQDGRWKWIRFSAAASPGNSGGPLLDAQGRVIGIVIGKSPNENLNYSLPISQVLEAPEHKARFDDRRLISLPYLHGTQTYIFQDGFNLPLSWTEFARNYRTVIARHEDASRERLLKTYADTLFPKGSGSEAVLYAPEANDFRPRLIEQQDDGSWSATAPYYTATDLPGDGSVSVANVSGAVLLRLVRSDNAADDALFANSRAFMDLALKGLNLRRPVGTDQVRVTSLGAALSDTMYVDRYGRKWQQRVWAIPFMDFYLESLLLPTPDGYCALILYVPSSIRAISEERLHLLANQIDVSYTGTLAQWRAYFARSAWLPKALTDVTLSSSPEWSLRGRRFSFTVPSSVLALDNRSVLTLTMGFVPDGDQVLWDLEEAWWNKDAQRKVKLGLWRRLRPPPTARLDLRSAFDDMRNRRDPYSGRWNRRTATISEVSVIVDAPGKKAGLVSTELLYGVSLHFEDEALLGNWVQLVQKLSSVAQILEKGPGESVVPAQPLASTLGEAFDSLARPLLEKSKQADSSFGRDLRGRLPSEDLQEMMTRIEVQFLAPGADAEALEQDYLRRTKTIFTYWTAVPALRHNRDLWGSFLARNRMPENTPHSQEVLTAEKALMDVLGSGEPSETSITFAHQLLDAYQRERKEAAHSMTVSDADYHARLTPCPAPATHTSNSVGAKFGAMPRSPGEFYPELSRQLYEEGRVLVSAQVSATGCALKFAIAFSSGSALLDDAAQRYAETIEFLPAERAGKAADSVKVFAVNFQLKD
ncbi:MAG TPA: TonB family protein [Steroidobacteraceae bacterium]|nr:TonB family protein [Steroidobacteraceae bacterium]